MARLGRRFGGPSGGASGRGPSGRSPPGGLAVPRGPVPRLQRLVLVAPSGRRLRAAVLAVPLRVVLRVVLAVLRRAVRRFRSSPRLAWSRCRWGDGRRRRSRCRRRGANPAKLALYSWLGIPGGYLLIGIGAAADLGIFAALGGLVTLAAVIGNYYFLIKGIMEANKMHSDNKIWMLFGIGSCQRRLHFFVHGTELPRVVKEVKQARGLAPTTSNLALYFFIPAYALALDLNQIDGLSVGGGHAGGFGGPPPGAPPGGSVVLLLVDSEVLLRVAHLPVVAERLLPVDLVALLQVGHASRAGVGLRPTGHGLVAARFVVDGRRLHEAMKPSEKVVCTKRATFSVGWRPSRSLNDDMKAPHRSKPTSGCHQMLWVAFWGAPLVVSLLGLTTCPSALIFDSPCRLRAHPVKALLVVIGRRLCNCTLSVPSSRQRLPCSLVAMRRTICVPVAVQCRDVFRACCSLSWHPLRGVGRTACRAFGGPVPVGLNGT